MSTAVELERLGRTQQLELQLTNYHFLSNPCILMSVQAMMNTTRITQAAFASLWSLTLSNISCPTWIRTWKNRPNLYRLTEPQTKCLRTYPDFITDTDPWDFMRKIYRTNCSFPWFQGQRTLLILESCWGQQSALDSGQISILVCLQKGISTHCCLTHIDPNFNPAISLGT
jgi:hypothetical protein